MKRMGVKNVVVGVVAVVGATGLVACESFEPIARPALETGENLYIAIDPDSVENLVLGKMYETVIERNNRITVLQLDESVGEDPFRGLNDGMVDLIIGCTGELLEHVDPVQARELEAEYREAVEAGDVEVNSGEWRDRTYAALLGSLPGHLAAADPSNATGCEGENELPQNIVPVYRTPAFVREDRETLNWVSGSMTTAELEELVSVVREEGASSEAVQDFVASKGG